MTNFQKEIEQQIITRQKQWDAGEYPHSESVFNASMKADKDLLKLVLRANNGIVAPKQRLTPRRNRVE
jgi:predicted GH43/DUF377 family glycosyl hydrolase